MVLCVIIREETDEERITSMLVSADKLTKKQNPHRLTRIIASSFVLISALSIYDLFPIQVDHAIALATTRQPESFTELYFDHQDKLPFSIKSGTNNYFVFQITNHESKTVTYHYQILQSSTTGSVAIGGGTVTLTDGDFAHKRVTFKLKAPKSSATLIVKLVDQNQQINFRSKS